MRAGAAAGSLALVLLVACTGGDGATRGRAGRPAVPASTSVVPTAQPTTPVPDAPGSVTLHAAGFSLPGAGGGGLRVLVRPSSPHVVVRRRGGGGPVTACPSVDVAGPSGPVGCADLDPGGTLELAAWGVELRARAGQVDVDEVTMTYMPADHSVVLVTPARPAGSCAPRPCTAEFSLSPSNPGTFSLDGRASGGHPRLTLSSNSSPIGSIRTLATVEGGGNLSIRATLDGVSEVTLAYREEGSGPVPALTAEILWP